MGWLGLGPASLARRARRGAVTPITADALPALGSLAGGEALSLAVSWGTYSSVAGSIVSPTTKEMNVNGGAYVPYNGATVVSAGDTYRLRETVSDDQGNSRSFATGAQTVSGVAPSVTASDSLSGRTLTITVDSATGTPVPSTALTALTLDGVDVSGDATGSGPWEYVVPDSAGSQTVVWTVTATNFEGSDTASGSEMVASNLSAPAVTASDSLSARTLTISVDTLTGAPAPAVSLTALTLDGADVLGDATGSSPWEYVVPDSASSRTVAWTIEATNSEGVDTASGAEAVAANLFAPTADTAPSIGGTVAPEETVTITEGTYSGPPAPTVSGILTLDGVDVTADMSGLDYTIPAGTEGQALAWTETATNGVFPDATQSVTQTVSAAARPEATGGTVTSITDPDSGLPYTAHTFTGNGDLVVTEGGEFEVMLVGPGGPGGSTFGYTATGGGSGGDVVLATLTLSPGTYPIAIGTAQPPSLSGPGAGTSTTAFSLTALPGGRGGGWASTSNLHNPTNGGGGHGNVNGVGATAPNYTGKPHPTSFSGGDGFEQGATGNANRGGGGGRGAGGDGQDGNIGGGGDGGPGVMSGISGTNIEYGRGGGGGARTETGGAPNGRSSPSNGAPGVNFGDGGGGGGDATGDGILGGAAANGVVIVRYAR